MDLCYTLECVCKRMFTCFYRNQVGILLMMLMGWVLDCTVVRRGFHIDLNNRIIYIQYLLIFKC